MERRKRRPSRILPQPSGPCVVHPVFFLTVMLQVLDMGKAEPGTNMLYYGLIFLLVAVLAGALGFLALAGVAALVARMLFVLFLLLFVISLVQRRRRRL